MSKQKSKMERARMERESKLTTMSLKRLASLFGREAPIVAESVAVREKFDGIGNRMKINDRVTREGREREREREKGGVL